MTFTGFTLDFSASFNIDYDAFFLMHTTKELDGLIVCILGIVV